MRIYQPVRGVGGALRENSFVMIDDAGVEIGQGGLEYRVIKKMMPDRPLDIEMTMSAHPVASDTLFGALSARAERIKDEEGGLIKNFALNELFPILQQGAVQIAANHFYHICFPPDCFS